MNTTMIHDAEGPIEAAVARAAHLLPAQRPIEAFVHHNTLHAFEHLPFEQAVRAAAERLGARPWMPEAWMREARERGRVLDVDLDQVIAEALPDAPLPVGTGQREALRRLMLGMPEDCSGPSLAWRLRETEVLRALPEDLPRGARERLLTRSPRGLPATLRALWDAAAAQARPRPPAPVGPRPRDRLLAAQGRDADLLVNPLLIRLAASFLDNGMAHWPMPERERGFLAAGLGALADGLPGAAWTRPLRARARALHEAGTPAAVVAAEALARMGVAEADLDEVVTRTLLALPGWAGMFVQLPARPDLAPGDAPPADLTELLALRLLLDEVALAAAPEVPAPAEDAQGLAAWRLFNAALLLGVDPEAPAELDAARAFLERWPAAERGRLWHLAYERRYRVQVLDALVARARVPAPAPLPLAQVVTCIDDREESLRRHLEELNPAWQTFGAAGFFGVPMAWRGLGQTRPRPLCPANLIPRHLVEERPDPARAGAWEAARAGRSRSGRVGWSAEQGSRGLLSGAALTLAGALSLVPMTARLLAPSLHARLSDHAAHVPTRVTLEHDPNEPQKDGYQLGFKLDEMIQITEGVLRGLGLVRDMAPLVALLGHGSTSRNNPHESAHDCGACGGGHGDANARVFALMANRPDVRRGLAARGVHVPEGTWFVGGFHNTATDAVVWFDLDAVPEALRPGLRRLQADLDEARRLDALERCRRFESAPLDLDPLGALRHVEDRAEDLAQPRPEYGHATNALCLVGRRDWSRGVFFDRRAFLTSYDPAVDPDGRVLEGLLAAVGPVGAGISLEYWFSFVDPARYGSGTKLPHNIVGLLGVMDGHASDLRTGLPWQMVEIHEPVRLLLVVEGRPERLEAVLARLPGVEGLVKRGWVLLAAFDPEAGEAWFYEGGAFKPHAVESPTLPRAATSVAWFRGRREPLPPALIDAALEAP